MRSQTCFHLLCPWVSRRLAQPSIILQMIYFSNLFFWTCKFLVKSKSIPASFEFLDYHHRDFHEYMNIVFKSWICKNGSSRSVLSVLWWHLERHAQRVPNQMRRENRRKCPKQVECSSPGRVWEVLANWRGEEWKC